MKFTTVKLISKPNTQPSPTGLPCYELINIPLNTNLKGWTRRLEELGCCGIFISNLNQPLGFSKINFWASREALKKLSTTFPTQEPQPQEPKQLSLF